jgi:hypothetical protein
MELVLRNPFRILGLPVTASSREVVKRVSDLEMFAEFGKTKAFPGDLSEIGEIDRSLDSIKEAARCIELPEMRVFYSFFWFHNGDAVDDLAIQSLVNFEFMDADTIWSDQLNNETVTSKATWRINRAVFSLWMSDELVDSECAFFEQALEDLAFASDDLYEEVTKLIPSSEQVNRKKVRQLIADALIDMAINSGDQAYGPNAIKALQYCSYFHEDTLKYIIAKITNPLANAIQDCVKKSEDKRNDGLSIDDLRRKNGLTKVEEFIYALRDALGESDPIFQAIANSFADEVIKCAINAINHHKAVTTAIVLAEWAADLPSYGHSRKWLMKERKKILAWDSDYVSEDDPDDGFLDEVEDLEPDVYEEEIENDTEEEAEEEIDMKPSKKRALQGPITCPTCLTRSEVYEVIEYTSFGVRCPHCNQSIVV